MTRTTKTVTVGGKEFTFDIGHVAKQAGGSTMVTFGDTAVLTTVCGAKEPRPGMNFLRTGFVVEGQSAVIHAGSSCAAASARSPPARSSNARDA